MVSPLFTTKVAVRCRSSRVFGSWVLDLARSAFVATRGLGRSEGDVLLSATHFCIDNDLCHLFLACGTGDFRVDCGLFLKRFCCLAFIIHRRITVCFIQKRVRLDTRLFRSVSLPVCRAWRRDRASERKTTLWDRWGLFSIWAAATFRASVSAL